MARRILLDPPINLFLIFAPVIKTSAAIAMKHDFLVRPPYLNQAFESSGGWGNGITRRSFIKRTGGATVASLVAWNLATTKSRGEGDGGTSGGSGSSTWKKRRWGCKRTLSGPSNQPYTQAQLDALALSYETAHNPWDGSPSGPPTGGFKHDPEGDDPETLEWWSSPEPQNLQTERRREPSVPKLQNWLNPADGKYYATYLYDYIEEKHEFTIPPGDGH